MVTREAPDGSLFRRERRGPGLTRRTGMTPE